MAMPNCDDSPPRLPLLERAGDTGRAERIDFQLSLITLPQAHDTH